MPYTPKPNHDDITTVRGVSEKKISIQVINPGINFGSSMSFVDLQRDPTIQIYKNSDGADGAPRNQGKQTLTDTDAFGQMEFVGGENLTRAKYIRLSDKTTDINIEALIQGSYGLTKWPSTLISVLGGAHNFDMPPNIQRRLQQQLNDLCLKVSLMPMEIWLVTKGTDCGVTKLVAEAMEGKKYKGTHLIGITNWERLHGKELLTQNFNEIKIPKYQVKNEATFSSQNENNHDYYLNPDHTHFLLVDTGGVDDVNRENKFRNNFLRLVASKQIEVLKASQEVIFGSQEFVSGIHLLINGGIRTLAHVKENFFPSSEADSAVIMPIVVMAGTGRVADWLTWMYEMDVTRHKELEEQIKKVFPDDYNEIYEDIVLCMEKKQYITIFHADRYGSLDDTIIRAFVKANKRDGIVSFEQLKMIMDWGRTDIAEEELSIIMEDERIESKHIHTLLEEFLLGSLRMEKMDFFDMILRIGFDINDFNKKMLTNLYKYVYLKDTNKQKNVLYTFLEPNKPELYLGGNKEAENFSSFLSQEPVGLLYFVKMEIYNLLAMKVVDYYDDDDEKLDDQVKELFIWAILCNKQKVATVLWKRGDDPIAKALIAKKMYQKMAIRYKLLHPYFDEHVYKSLLRRARYFEFESLNLLEKCSMVSTTRAAELVDISLPRWDDKSCMDLAEVSIFEQFIAHQRCQDNTNKYWHGDFTSLRKNLNLKIFMSICCPPLLWLLAYNPTYRHLDQWCCRSDRPYGKAFCKIRGMVNKVYSFYNAPVTKFWRNSIFYCFFLMVFAYFQLTPVDTTVGIAEYIILAFCLAFLTDEVRSIVEAAGITLRQKVKAWWRDPWNKIDCLGLICFLIAFILLRLQAYSRTCLVFSDYFYAVDYVIWTLRLLQIISMHEKIGVYVVMLQRMVGDVIYFIAIIFVFVFGYGVARTSILYHEEQLSFDFVHKQLGQRIFLKPIFHVFGDLFLDTTANETEKTVFSTTVYNDSGQSVMLFLQFAYMILTNLLFINLLIAVFNNTYEAVERHSDRISKWQYYITVNEYRAGQILPAPFSAIGNSFFFMKTIYYHMCRRKNQQRTVSYDIPMEKYFQKDTNLNSMKQFENECLSKYLMERQEYTNRFLKKTVAHTTSANIPSQGEIDNMQNKNLGTEGGFLLYGSDSDDDD